MSFASLASEWNWFPVVGIWLLDFLLLKAVSGEEDRSFYNSMAAAARLGGLELEECDVLFFDIDG